MTTAPNAFSLPLSPFAGFVQVAYVTTDLAQAIELFASHHGVPAWARLLDLEVEVQPGRTARKNIGLAWVGALQLELIEPLSGDDTVFREPLPTEGFGIRFHHVAQLIDSEAQYERQRAALVAQGLRLAVDGQSHGGAVRYCYSDHRQTLGHYIEHIWYSPPALAGMRQMVPQNPPAAQP